MPVEFVVKLIEPVGITAVPAVEVSVTVTAQIDAWFITIGLAQLTAVLVVRRLIVMLNTGPVPPL